MKAYLCGCITWLKKQGREDEAIEWRIKMKNLLEDIGVKSFDPCLYFEENGVYTYKSIVKQNDYYLDLCNVIVANSLALTKSAGSLYEIYYYYWQNKPVIVFGREPLPRLAHLQVAVDEHFVDMGNVVKYFKKLLPQLREG